MVFGMGVEDGPGLGLDVEGGDGWWCWGRRRWGAVEDGCLRLFDNAEWGSCDDVSDRCSECWRSDVRLLGLGAGDADKTANGGDTALDFGESAAEGSSRFHCEWEGQCCNVGVVWLEC